MNVTVTIDTDNAAFADDAGWEVARILRELADRLAVDIHQCHAGPIRDVNGNTCGTWTVTP